MFLKAAPDSPRQRMDAGRVKAVFDGFHLLRGEPVHKLLVELGTAEMGAGSSGVVRHPENQRRVKASVFGQKHGPMRGHLRDMVDVDRDSHGRAGGSRRSPGQVLRGQRIVEIPLMAPHWTVREEVAIYT